MVQATFLTAELAIGHPEGQLLSGFERKQVSGNGRQLQQAATGSRLNIHLLINVIICKSVYQHYMQNIIRTCIIILIP